MPAESHRQLLPPAPLPHTSTRQHACSRSPCATHRATFSLPSSAPLPRTTPALMPRRSPYRTAVASHRVISAMFEVKRIEEAKDLFAAISANGLVPSVETYCLMMTNLIKEELLEEAANLFSSMEKTGCAPNSHLLNHVIRVLLEKGEIIKAGNYLSKIDEKNLSLEASTTSLLILYLSSRGKGNFGNT